MGKTFKILKKLEKEAEAIQKMYYDMGFSEGFKQGVTEQALSHKRVYKCTSLTEK